MINRMMVTIFATIVLSLVLMAVTCFAAESADNLKPKQDNAIIVWENLSWGMDVETVTTRLKEIGFNVVDTNQYQPDYILTHLLTFCNEKAHNTFKTCDIECIKLKTIFTDNIDKANWKHRPVLRFYNDKLVDIKVDITDIAPGSIFDSKEYLAELDKNLQKFAGQSSGQLRPSFLYGVVKNDYIITIYETSYELSDPNLITIEQSCIDAKSKGAVFDTGIH
jgi:hypothetical protein